MLRRFLTPTIYRESDEPGGGGAGTLVEGYIAGLGAPAEAAPVEQPPATPGVSGEPADFWSQFTPEAVEAMPQSVRDTLAEQFKPSWYGERLGEDLRRQRETVQQEADARVATLMGGLQPQAPQDTSMVQINGTKYDVDPDTGCAVIGGYLIPADVVANLQRVDTLEAKVNTIEQRDEQKTQTEAQSKLTTTVSEAYANTFPAELKDAGAHYAARSAAQVRQQVALFKAEEGFDCPPELIADYAKELAAEDLKIFGAGANAQLKLNATAKETGVIAPGGAPAVPGDKTYGEMTPAEREDFIRRGAELATGTPATI